MEGHALSWPRVPGLPIALHWGSLKGTL